MKLEGIPQTSDIVYYRCYLSRDSKPVIVCMQNFDEGDYRSDEFLTNSRWTEESEAIDEIRPFRLAWLKGVRRWSKRRSIKCESSGTDQSVSGRERNPTDTRECSSVRSSW